MAFFDLNLIARVRGERKVGWVNGDDLVGIGGDAALQMAVLIKGPGAVHAGFPRKGRSAETRTCASLGCGLPTAFHGICVF